MFRWPVLPRIRSFALVPVTVDELLLATTRFVSVSPAHGAGTPWLIESVWSVLAAWVSETVFVAVKPVTSVAVTASAKSAPRARVISRRRLRREVGPRTPSAAAGIGATAGTGATAVVGVSATATATATAGVWAFACAGVARLDRELRDQVTKPLEIERAADSRRLALERVRLVEHVAVLELRVRRDQRDQFGRPVHVVGQVRGEAIREVDVDQLEDALEKRVACSGDPGRVGGDRRMNDLGRIRERAAVLEALDVDLSCQRASEPDSEQYDREAKGAPPPTMFSTDLRDL